MRAIVVDAVRSQPEVREVPEPAAPAGGVVVGWPRPGCAAATGTRGRATTTSSSRTCRATSSPARSSRSGPGSTRWQVGDRVTVPFVCGCGRCEWCSRGDAQVCPDQEQPGFTHWGSFAELVALHAADTNLVAIPDAVDVATAASLGCRFATAYRALVGRARVTPGEWVMRRRRRRGRPERSDDRAGARRAGGGGRPQPRGTRTRCRARRRAHRARRRDRRPRGCRGAHRRWQPRGGRRRRQRADLRRRDPRPAPSRTARAGRPAASRRGPPARAHGPGDRVGARPARQPRDGRGRLPRDAGADRAGRAGAAAARRAHGGARARPRACCPASTGCRSRG